ncbi:hypothetical protein FUAX_07310 [Fulvitalea axinellae]|uniref:Uncharacterized protein n=1 Tax=Fulvitalea axinellae TaxID=1182444 RepID=A0AAU9D1I4_9BACT|nr:hypothetical protein FUAX_07310 [Fulvitalea axinellae]
MKRAIFILIIQLFPILTFGQSKDSIYSTLLLDKYVNRCIDSLDSIEYLKINNYSKRLDFCNLASCFTFLEAYDKDTLLNQALYVRLEQIARRFYSEGTPVLIHRGGMNSTELCERLNKEGNPYGITYVSLGNACVSYGSMDIGIKKFNEETKRLVDYIATEDRKKKKKEKRGTTKNKTH